MQFFIFLDDVGAEVAWARINRREMIYPDGKQFARARPTGIRPLEVIQASSGVRGAAGGYLLLGPVGAALGALMSKGPTVRFEIYMLDGSTRQGVIEQTRFGAFRRKIGNMQNYQSGDVAKSVGYWSLVVIAASIFGAAMGPLGLFVGPGIIWGMKTLRDRRRKHGEAQNEIVSTTS